MTKQVRRSLWVAAVVLGIVGTTATGAMAAGPAGDDSAAGLQLAQSVAPAERAPQPGGHEAMRGGGRGGGGSPEQVERMRDTALFRALDDPTIRAEIGLTAEQETQIADLQKKAKTIVENARAKAQLQYGVEEPGEGRSDEDRQGRTQDTRRAMGQAMRDIQPELQAIMQETLKTLSQEQGEALRSVVETRQRLMPSCGNLWILATRTAKEELGLTDEVAGKIKKILEDTASQANAKRRELWTSARDVPPAERREAMQSRQQDLTKSLQESAKKAKEDIFALLTPEQKEKAEALLARQPKEESGGSAMPMGGGMTGGSMRGGGGGGMMGGPTRDRPMGPPPERPMGPPSEPQSPPPPPKE